MHSLAATAAAALAAEEAMYRQWMAGAGVLPICYAAVLAA